MNSTSTSTCARFVSFLASLPLAENSQATSIFTWSVKTPKANIPRSAVEVNEGTEHEVVIQESVFTRRGVDRILRYAFKTCAKPPRKTLTSATKSNGLAISVPYWDERVEAMAENYPGSAGTKQHIDILCARFVMQPERFDVVVASIYWRYRFPILACTGTIGIAPSITEIRNALSRRSSGQSTVPRRISTGKTLLTLSPRFGPCNDARFSRQWR